MDRRQFLSGAIPFLSVAGNASATLRAAAASIGFLVKMPEQPWFITEQAAATRAGQRDGFSVLRFGVPDGERVMTAIDTLAALGAKGFVICAPDVRLGTAIRFRARHYGMRLVSVDDQLVDRYGRPFADIPHLGMSGARVGEQVGQSIAAEVKRRGWRWDKVRALRLSNNELPTARERTNGATRALVAAGMPAANIIDAPQRATDTEAAFTAASATLARSGGGHKWVMFALNEDSVLGGVRATEQLGMPAGDVIGIGIGGASAALAEFRKGRATGFVGTIALPTDFHGAQSARNLVRWIATGRAPPVNTVSTGQLMTRANWQAVSRALAA